ncbi:zinc ribbon domain-containing protein [uncultured Methanobrevibacter sp.]|uniref:zinc ribbon domain-containing protein n=1 Tax=uncultured Methanobrevibacter sp. TaxID=253161 RepID=UPI0025D10C93|nr:zinc ribbon domain-containing protein [uncultured Methanobrevibacter sp.]
MECPKCNRTYEDDFKFCPYCGEEKPKPKICPKCKLEPPIEFSFCPECGEKLVTQDELMLNLKNMVNTSSLTEWEKEHLMKLIKSNEINEEKLTFYIDNPVRLKNLIISDLVYFIDSNVSGRVESIIDKMVENGEFDEIDDYFDVWSIVEDVLQNPYKYGYEDDDEG